MWREAQASKLSTQEVKVDGSMFEAGLISIASSCIQAMLIQ